MIEDVLFLSVDQMKRMRPSLNTVVISILDESESYARPKLAGWRSVLKLTFEDVFEECKCAEPGAWPDEPTDEEHARFCMGRGERIPTLTDARRIVDFVRDHHESDEKLNLIVHCFGGISRSAAVAAWASSNLWVPIGNTGMKTTEHANKRLLRLMDKAYDLRLKASQVPSQRKLLP